MRAFACPLALALAACAAASHSATTPICDRVPLAVPAGPPPADVTAMLAEISPERLGKTVARLASFGTRHTLSDASSETRGIGAARRFIAAELQTLPPLQVSLESHPIP